MASILGDRVGTGGCRAGTSVAKECQSEHRLGEEEDEDRLCLGKEQRKGRAGGSEPDATTTVVEDEGVGRPVGAIMVRSWLHLLS